MTEDRWTLADKPYEWRDHPSGFRQRWLPGAFGDLEVLEGDVRFEVLKEEWDETQDPPLRTIIETKILAIEVR